MSVIYTHPSLSPRLLLRFHPPPSPSLHFHLFSAASLFAPNFSAFPAVCLCICIWKGPLLEDNGLQLEQATFNLNKNARTLAVQVECISHAFPQSELQPVERIFRDKRQKGPHSGALKATGSFMIAVFMLLVCCVEELLYISKSKTPSKSKLYFCGCSVLYL